MSTNCRRAWARQWARIVCNSPGRLRDRASHIWIGGPGTILHTSNGGATWTPQTSGTPNGLSGVAFPDASNGWAVGFNGQIVHTANGGATWTPQTSGTANDLTSVTF